VRVGIGVSVGTSGVDVAARVGIESSVDVGSGAVGSGGTVETGETFSQAARTNSKTSHSKKYFFIEIFL
jgi:hypothetical protein